MYTQMRNPLNSRFSRICARLFVLHGGDRMSLTKRLHLLLLANGLSIGAITATLAAFAALGSVPAYCGEKVLHSFEGTDGEEPYSGLTIDGAGNLYGTTYAGGTGGGVVYRLTPDGTETVLHSFGGGDDGVAPLGGVIFDSAGNLYGTTAGGGASNAGTVYRLSSDGTETVLYSFEGNSDGNDPTGSLASDSSGNLYGTTYYGGDMTAPECDGEGCGTVFELKTNGQKVTLHTFTNEPDGQWPADGVTLDNHGNLFGTTRFGGAAGCAGGGCGSVFEITPGGAESVSYSFCSQPNCTDGAWPLAGLMLGKHGNLFGTTSSGYYGGGVVFELTPAGKETVLHSFANSGDGKSPQARLIADKTGNLYGTTFYGGDGVCRAPHHIRHCGIAFEITEGGTETVLIDFKGSGGYLPAAPLVLGPKGILYGTASEGGAKGYGVVFSVEK